MLRIICGASALLLMLCAPLAAAMVYDSASAADCMHGSGYARIEACSRVIGSGQVKGKALAAVLISRGFAEIGKHETDAAIADFSRAIQLTPDDPGPYVMRGLARYAKADWKEAHSDFDHALRLDPDRVSALLGRGALELAQQDAKGAIRDFDRVIALRGDNADAYEERAAARMLAGDLDGVMADLDKARALAPDDREVLYPRGMVRFLKGDEKGAVDDLMHADPGKKMQDYRAILLYLARTRAGQDGKPALAAAVAKAAHQWPYPVMAFLLGRITPQQLLQEAGKPGAAQQGNKCEANYYLAEWYLLKDDKGHAGPLLRKAVDSCPKDFDEYFNARVRLKQLGKK